MNKLVKLSLLIAVLLSTATFSLAEMGYISLDMHKSEELAPDRAQIVIAVETHDKSSKVATDENKKISTQLQTKIKMYIDEKNGDYVKTSNYSLSPRYTYKNGQENFDKYVVQNSVIVYTRNLDNVSKIIDTANSNGATNINNLNYSVSNYDDICTNMITNLVSKSQANANKMLSPIGQKVASVKHISTSCSSSSSENRLYLAKSNRLGSGMMADSTESTPINQGKVTVNASINVSYFVKAKN